MGNSGGLGQIIIAIFLVLVGVILISDIIQTLLWLIGWITIIVGIVVGLWGSSGCSAKTAAATTSRCGRRPIYRKTASAICV